MPEYSSFILVPGEVLVTPFRTSITPTTPQNVSFSQLNFTIDVVESWFIQSIEPLVGPDAAEKLQGLIDNDVNRTANDGFLNTAKTFRQSFVPVAQ
jgi:hypothetical protein